MISLCQMYKQREIFKKKKIYKYQNLADFIIKTKLSSTFKTLIDTNYIKISTITRVE